MQGKRTSRNIDEAVGKAVNFELTVAEIARRSEKRAWRVAIAALLMALALAGCIACMLPLKQKVPFVVMADAYTGTASVARLTNFNDHQISANEALNRSNLAHFVMARESYDASSVGQRNWVTVLTMASPRVASVYRSLFSSSNPDNPITLYGKNNAIRVKILSIVLNGGTPASRNATVRFQRLLYNEQSGATKPLDSKIATIAFTYKADLQMDDQYRIENPLGFQVLDYRVDNDYDATPPIAVLDADSMPPAVVVPASAPAAPASVAATPPTSPRTPTPAAAGTATTGTRR